MSYCRANGEDSDVYVVMSGELTCLGCELPGGNPAHRYYVAKSRIDMIGHLGKHRLAGDKVPQRAITRLYREMDEEIAAG